MGDLVPALTIAPPAWMRAPETVSVMAAFPECGTSGPGILFVGGCVRNTLLGQRVDDIDLATVFPPDQVVAYLTAAGLRAVPTGIDHGTVTAVSGGKGFEITTLRRDLETDGRRAVVGFTQDWCEDAQRRDFTMNTLLAGLDGTIYDPLGCALADLRAGRVVFVGDPDQRIAEDRLRVLRFFRFHGAYGRGAPDSQALAACTRAAGMLGDLSRERVTGEILKILKSDDPVKALDPLFKCGILAELSPRDGGACLRRVCVLQTAHDAFCLEARILALLDLDEDRLLSIEERMILSGKTKDLLRAILMAEKSSREELKNNDNALFYKHNNDVSEQAVLLAAAHTGVTEGLAGRLARIRAMPRPVFPISGKDLLAAGLEPGPRLGAVLSDIEGWWMAQGCAPDRAALLARLSGLL